MLQAIITTLLSGRRCYDMSPETVTSDVSDPCFAWVRGRRAVEGRVPRFVVLSPPVTTHVHG